VASAFVTLVVFMVFRRSWFGLDLAVTVGYSMYLWAMITNRDERGFLKLVFLPWQKIALWHLGFLATAVGVERAVRIWSSLLLVEAPAHWGWLILLLATMFVLLVIAQLERILILRKPTERAALTAEEPMVADHELWLLSREGRTAEGDAAMTECEQMLQERSAAGNKAGTGKGVMVS
jgi:hypothetical protein